MRGFGIVLRHDFDLISERMIWEMAQTDLPRLPEDCRPAVGILEAEG